MPPKEKAPKTVFKSFEDVTPETVLNEDADYESYLRRKEKERGAEIEPHAKKLMKAIADTIPKKSEEEVSIPGTEKPSTSEESLGTVIDETAPLIYNDAKKRAPRNKAEKIDRLLEEMQAGDQIEVTEGDETILYTVKQDGNVSFTVQGIEEVIPIDRMKKHLESWGVAFKKTVKEEKPSTPEKKISQATTNLEENENKKKLLEEFNAFLMNEVQEIEKSGLRDKTKLYIEFSKKYNLGITSIKEVKTPEEIENEKRIAQEREQTIKKIGELFRNGVDKIVVHGNTVENANGEFGLVSNPDADTTGALYLLNDIAHIKYNNGAQTEIVGKGQEVPPEVGKVIVHIDVSGKTLSIIDTDTGAVIFVDHHQEQFDKKFTSATEIVFEILTKNNLIEEKSVNNEALKNFTDFITNVDNLLYVDYEDFPNILKYKWAGSLFAIYKQLPIEFVVNFFNEGRDPWDPKFTKAEKKNITWEGKYRTDENSEQQYEKDTGKPLREKVSLGQVLVKNNRAFNYALTEGFPFAVEQMKKNGIKSETQKMGKVLFNTTDPQIGKDGKEKTNWLVGEMGFLFAKANGYDTYVDYNKNEGQTGRTNSYFINSTTYDLEPVVRELQQIVPETVMVRGVMIIGPQSSAKRAPMTEEKFFKATGLKE